MKIYKFRIFNEFKMRWEIIIVLTTKISLLFNKTKPYIYRKLSRYIYNLGIFIITSVDNIICYALLNQD